MRNWHNEKSYALEKDTMRLNPRYFPGVQGRGNLREDCLFSNGIHVMFMGREFMGSLPVGIGKEFNKEVKKNGR